MIKVETDQEKIRRLELIIHGLRTNLKNAIQPKEYKEMLASAQARNQTISQRNKQIKDLQSRLAIAINCLERFTQLDDDIDINVHPTDFRKWVKAQSHIALEKIKRQLQ